MSQTTNDPPITIFDAIRRGERKKEPLLLALRATSVDKSNITHFVAAMNELQAPIAAEFIALTWHAIDSDCRVQVIREWLDRKDKDQQASGYHALAARLLTQDAASAMDFLDRALKLARSSTACLKRVVMTTRLEWIGNTLEQARFRNLNLSQIASNSRLVILDWLCEACFAELRPLDDERRKEQVRKQAEARTALVIDWMEQQQRAQLPEIVSVALDRCLTKLGSKVAEVLEDANTLGVSEAAAPTPPTSTPLTRSVPGNPQPGKVASVSAQPDDLLRELFDPIRLYFNKESERFRRSLHDMEIQLSAARSRVDRAEADAHSYRNANAKALSQLSEMEKTIGGLNEANRRLTSELALLQPKVIALSAELEAERRRSQAQRDESHNEVSRETERERERLLTQLGQKTRHIVQSYREIRSRGPLPDGTPTMVADMMDEMLSRLEAAGLQFAQD